MVNAVNCKAVNICGLLPPHKEIGRERDGNSRLQLKPDKLPDSDTFFAGSTML
jgi:hypothetical protein